MIPREESSADVRHLTSLEVGAFVHDKAAKRRLKAHVTHCRQCLRRILLRNRRCSAIRPRFDGLVRGTLRKTEAEDTKEHLRRCWHCYEAYLDEAQKLVDAEPEILDAAPVGPRLIWTTFGPIAKIPALQHLAPSALPLAAKSGSRRTTEEGFEGWEKGRLKVSLVPERGRLIATVTKDGSLAAGVTVEIGLSGPERFEAVAKAITDSQGKARLGLLKNIPPPPGETKYHLRITPAKSKSKR